MNKLINWLSESNRIKHLTGGFLIGFIVMVLGLLEVPMWAYPTICGVIAGGALELKDKMYGQGWDWIDFGLAEGLLLV